MTKEQIVRKVIDGLRAQGGYSMGMGSCMYKAHDGKRCAAGLLMPDDTDFVALEFDPITMRRHTVALAKGGIESQGSLDLVRALQEIHDDCAQGSLPLETCLARMEALLS